MPSASAADLPLGDADPLPEHASVVVIGGGIMGCSVLYHLAKEGVGDALMLERNKLGSGTTWHSAAQVRALRSSENLTRLMRYSIDLYARIQEETGQSAGWRNTGSLSIACSHGRLAHLRRQEGLAKLYGVRARPADAGEIREKWPLANADDVIGATWSPDDGRVGPSDACAALIKGAVAGGAKVAEDAPVTGILTRSGKIAGVETPRGAVRCDAVALCAGLWSRDAAAMAGASAPLWPCEHFYLLTAPHDGVPRDMPTLSDHDSHLYIRDDSGGLLVGCFEPNARAIDPRRLGQDFAFQLLPEDWDHFAPMMENAMRRVPLLAEAKAKAMINGPESFTPDGMFLLGEAAETDGLFLGCGMNSVGIASAGGAGFALARQIASGRAPMALPESAPARFSACWNSAAALAERAPETLGRHYEIACPGRQPRTARNLRLSPLHETWKAHGAQFGQFGGWERPLYFGGIGECLPTFERPAWHEQTGAEVMQAHERAAIFDVSMLGKIAVRGPGAESFLDRALSGDMQRPPGRVTYSLMLDESGGILGDLTALRLASDHYRLCTGTEAIGRDLAHLKKLARGCDVVIEDETDAWAMIALCGPGAAQVVAAAGAPELIRLPYFRCAAAAVGGKAVHASRMSYVGEFGWEIACAAEDAEAVCRALLEAGAAPAGLYAQSSMRIEKKFPAFGHDMDSDLTPLEAGLEFAVAWESPFAGREALLARKKEGARKRLIAIVLDDASAVPIGGEPVYANGAIAGKTTSAAFGFRLRKPAALALLDAQAAAPESRAIIDIAGSMFEGKVSDGAPFDPSGLRMRTLPA